jgi:hypothetical protein
VQYSRAVSLSKRDLPDLLRSVGGVLFAVGAVLMLTRESGHHGWGDFAQLLVVLIPAVFLYLLALGVLEDTPSTSDEKAQPWQSVLMVIAILLVPVVLREFLAWVGANTGHVLYGAGVFAVQGVSHRQGVGEHQGVDPGRLIQASRLSHPSYPSRPSQPSHPA